MSNTSPITTSDSRLLAQLIPLDGVMNARELGGYALPDGRRVKWGMLLRGGALDKATGDDLRRLEEQYHVARIFDFRSEMEVRHAPDQVPAGMERMWLPTIDPNTEKLAKTNLPATAYHDLGRYLIAHAGDATVQTIARRMYSEMVLNEYTQLQYASFLHVTANMEEGAVYWHCSQGKDRTGLGAAFLLAALGADRELIMSDFALSAEYYKEMVETLKARVRENGGDLEAEKVIDAFVGVSCENFETALDLIEQTHGSLQDYLRDALCLTDADRERLRDRFTE